MGNGEHSFIAIAPRSTLARIDGTWQGRIYGQIEQTVCKQMTDAKLWLLYSNTWNQIIVCKIWASAYLKMLSTKRVYKSYIFNIYIYKEDLALNNLQWLTCHKT